jgi:hypothetical protein
LMKQPLYIPLDPGDTAQGVLERLSFLQAPKCHVHWNSPSSILNIVSSSLVHGGAYQ